MGYNTTFRITVEGSSFTDFFKAIGKLPKYNREEVVSTIACYNGIPVDLDNIDKICGYGKWYDHEEDLKLISSYFDGIIHVYGEGDTNGDMWHKSFKKGLMQRRDAIITFPEYDPEGFE